MYIHINLIIGILAILLPIIGAGFLFAKTPRQNRNYLLISLALGLIIGSLIFSNILSCCFIRGKVRVNGFGTWQYTSSR
jgi:hypothetical protein